MSGEDENADAQTLAAQLNGVDEATLVQAFNLVLQNRPEMAPALANILVPDFTYPPSKALSERRSEGTIKSFSWSKGWGFIECQELKDVFENDVFVHGRQIAGFSPGEAVSFAVMLSKENKPQAYDLQPVGGGKGGGGKGWAAPTELVVLPQVKPTTAPHTSSAGKAAGKGKAAKGSWTPSAVVSWQPGAVAAVQKRKAVSAANGGASAGPDIQMELGRMVGLIKSFNASTGYGFIQCPKLQQLGYTNDAFLHHEQLGSFDVGAEVAFTAFVNSKGQPQAKDLQPARGGFKRLKY